MGQPPHGPLHFAAQSPHVYADTPQQKYRQRIVLAHEHIEQMQRFDGLMPCSLARDTAACSASCALIVKELMFIVHYIIFNSFL